MQQRLTIGWKVSTLNPALASLRYRAMLPLLALERSGINGEIFSKPSRACLTGLDALIIVKSFTLEDYWLAQEACKMKVPVIFDLCDNIFIDQYQEKNQTSPADFFLLIANFANAIVVTTEPLASIVREKIGGQIPVYVIPDGIETAALLAAIRSRLWLPRFYEYFHRLITNSIFSRLLHQGRGKLGLLKSGTIVGISRKLLKSAGRSCKDSFRYLSWRFWAKLAYRHYDQFRAQITGSIPKLASNVKAAPVGRSVKSASNVGKPATIPMPVRRIVWFGNHGAKHANFGMLDLLIIREQLEKLAAEFPLELVVISNSLEKYNKHIRPMAIPSRYIEWNTADMSGQLQKADVVVIPNSLDAFSICKSANRAVKALAHGKPVVATATPALEELRGCIVLDDFEGGLRRYLRDSELAKMDVQKGQKLIELLYGQHAIGRLWNELINEVIHNSGRLNTDLSPELIVVIQLPQDTDLAKPVLDAATSRGIRCVIWSSLAAIQRWPQLANWIQNMGMDWSIFPDDLKGFGASSIFPKSVYALLAITETNLNPHHFAHHLTKLANAASIYTATMQHGYENVGLTYSDDEHDIKHVRFASRKIFTWGHLETLHPGIPQQTLKKCFPVGFPKSDSVAQAFIGDWVSDKRPVIGIFENLHWHRYSDEYRKFFLEGVWGLTDTFPSVDFIIKPHNAGMWLTSRYQGNKPVRDNLIIIDPKDAQWASITAPQLFGQMDGVITTPSTVALDAARIKMPVAVVAQGMDLNNYEPLPIIRHMQDWIDFVSQIADADERKKLQEKSRQFVERVLLPGNAAWRIVEEIESHNQNGETRNAA